MTIKLILCLYQGKSDERAAMNAAFCLADQFSAHVNFLHIADNPASYMYANELIMGPQIIEMVEKQNAIDLDSARSDIRAAAERHKISVGDTWEPGEPNASLTVRMARPEPILEKEACYADIIITSPGLKLPSPYNDPLLPVLFGTGRPVLLMPRGDKPTDFSAIKKNIAVAWDDSLQASTALHHAIPFLEAAEQVHLLHAGKDHHEHPIPARVSNYLKAHGLHKVHSVNVDRINCTTAEAILALAHNVDATLLIMGAYSHKHFAEMILGGVTEEMLRIADMPLLLAH